MKALPRVLCVLLCLLLAAKGSVAAMLSVTGVSGYEQPEPDTCPFVSLAYFGAPHHFAALQAHPEQASSQDNMGRKSQPHHHHPCAPLCAMQAALAAPILLPAAAAGLVPALTPQVISSIALSPPLHPPRTGG